jgi:AbrB family looped-hinge helix DNA binding protein
MVTFNGRITLPPQVRKKLGLRIGDNVDFVENDKGQFAITHRETSIRVLNSRVLKQDAAPTAEEMDENTL